MGTVTVDAGLGLRGGAGALGTLVDRRLAARGVPGLDGPVDAATAWRPAAFGLDVVHAFEQADEAVQRAVLAACARGRLVEAYFIEKAGVAYAAKMALLADDLDERVLYALVGAEEATHLDAVSRALGPVDEEGWQADPFLLLLRDLVEDGDRVTGQLVIQVVLEGWGLTHYADLRDTTAHPGLRALFARIVADEAGHHGAGVQLLKGVTLTAAQRRAATEALDAMLGMVQAGPVLVLGSLERAVGGLTRPQRVRVLDQLDAAGHVHHRLAVLRACLDRVPAARPVTDALAAAGRFDVPDLDALAGQAVPA